MSIETNNALHQKLDAFIRKYYKNQLVKGLIYGVGLSLAFFLLAAVFEYFGEFETTGRTILFWIFIGACSFILGKFIAIPLFKLSNLGKVISHEQAASIVGDHFTDVKDKLLNTLQLKQMSSDESLEQYALVQASVNQRIDELSPVPFTAAIDLSENKKYIGWLVVPILLIGGVLAINSDIITGSTDRLLNHGTKYEKMAPFTFIISNDSLGVVEKEDFTLMVQMKGIYVPEKVYIDIDGRRIKLEQENKVTFKHTFKNVRNNTSFFLTAEEYDSKDYEITTIPNPIILNFDVELDYPAYTHKQDHTLKNTGDLIVPEGTLLKWKFKTASTKEVQVEMNDSLLVLMETLAGQFELEKRIFNSANYSVRSKNEFRLNKNEVTYFLNAIKDEYPVIDMEERLDSLNKKHKYFSGNIGDDYGFSKLTFNYRISNKENPEEKSKLKSEQIKVNGNFNKDQFFHFWDVSKINLNPGDQVEYYFVVWDNDGVNGSKSARTRTQVFSAPSKKELSDNADEANDKIKKDLEQSIKEAQQIKKELKDLQKDMFDKKELNWQDKNKIQDLLNRQKQLENKVDQVKQQNKENNQQQKEYNELSKELMEKQKLLEELFDKIMDEEMKKLYEELQELMDELDKDKVQEKLEEMKWEQEDVEKSLDESLELFKQFEFEQKIEDMADKLEELAEKQDKLSEETKDKKEDSEELKEKQDKLNEEFEDIKEDMEKLDEMNEDLDKKHDLDEAKEDMEEIEQKMDESSEELSESKEKKASEKQKSAAEQMKESAAAMKAMMKKQQAEQASEDMQALRMLLENLITFSFDQEIVMEGLKPLSKKDPKYVDLGREQRKLKDDAKIIEDSLVALSKRQAMIANIVGDEIRDMKRGIAKSIENIKERQTRKASADQQGTMTAANNLALLLDEALQQMQQQAASKMPGTGQCEKPGGAGKKPSSGKPSQSLSQMRKDMQKQLEKMKDALGKGKKPGDKPGDKGNKGDKPGQGAGGTGGMPSNSEELAKLAAQQAAIRKQIQQLSQDLNKDGSGNGNGLKQIAKDMEKLEEDIVNKRFTSESLNRQKEIVTRLLEHEKAERQKEFDNKRKSEKVKNQEYSNPKQFLEYKRRKEKEIELLKTVPADLKQYYKNKVNEYFNKVD
jgi:hypothetical protein